MCTLCMDVWSECISICDLYYFLICFLSGEVGTVYVYASGSYFYLTKMSQFNVIINELPKEKIKYVLMTY